MKLEQIRKEKGISQSQLATKMNVTQGAVSQWENGQVKPRADTLIKLAAILGCTVDELLKGEEKDAT